MNGENISFFTMPEIWSIIASIVSVILGFFAIGISIWFFVINRGTEKNVSNSLTKIETQASILQKISGRQLDRFTKYFTEPKASMPEEFFTQLISVLSHLPSTLITQGQQLPSQQMSPEVTQFIIMFYIITYFYTAQTNIWAQSFLPDADDFDEQNSLHIGIKRVIEMSFADCCSVANILQKCEQQQLVVNPLNDLLIETRDIWKDYVKTCSQIYEARAKEKSEL